jgi:hypothetical protein
MGVLVVILVVVTAEVASNLRLVSSLNCDKSNYSLKHSSGVL